MLNDQRTACTYFIDTLVSVKYNKTLKTLLLRLYKIYTALDESLVTNIAVTALPRAIFATLLSSRAYKALSNMHKLNFIH